MNQLEYFGFGSISKIRDILEKEKPKKIFLVSGRNSYKTSGAEKILNFLLKNYELFRFYDFVENPKIEEVENGIKFFRENKYDIIIAIGGGTVIDMAKLINILSTQDEEVRDCVFNQRFLHKSKLPLVAVPTTAGTGSEATHFAVVYIDKKKYSVAHESVLPNYIILDPRLTMNLPSYITASTGVDALSQGIEAYWSAYSTEESKKYAKEAIELVLDNILQAVNNPTRKSRENMLLGANLAGKAINIAKTTAPHAISYTFTSYFGIPHGHAVGLTLGEMFFYNSLVSERDVTDMRGIKYIKKVFSELNEILGCSSAEASKDKIVKIMYDCGLKTRLSELGVKSNDDIELVCNNVNTERLKNNPRSLTKQALKKILVSIK